MCPVCMATAAILYGSTAGAGGLTTLVTGKFLKHRATNRAQALQQNQGRCIPEPLHSSRRDPKERRPWAKSNRAQ